MDFLKLSENKLSYTDVLQLDGAFSRNHLNYDKSPIFNGIDGKTLTENSRKNSLLSQEKIKNVIECGDLFDGTEINIKRNDSLLLWKNYWLEYINAFDKLTELLPCSIVTIFVGRQAIEIGFKYLLLKRNSEIKTTHDLGDLSKQFFTEYKIQDSYMDSVDVFCEKYSKYIEGGKVEYFRYPKYKNNTYFAGNYLDIKWLSYNFILIILKLIHFAGLDTEV